MDPVSEAQVGGAQLRARDLWVRRGSLDSYVTSVRTVSCATKRT